MRRTVALAFFFCFASSTAFPQSGVHGKWVTDRPADPSTITDGQRKQSVQLNVAIANAKASGTITIGGLGGTFYTFDEGKVTGNKVQFRTDPPTAPTWTIETVDDNTVLLYHGSLAVVEVNGPGQSSPIPVGAVDSNASIRGVVQDKAKALIPGVTVTATNIDTGAKFTTITNAAGLYGLSGVMPGRYTMTASIPGFKTTTLSNLGIGDTRFLQDFTLEIPAAQSSANPTVDSCSRNGVLWCTLLHRAK